MSNAELKLKALLYIFGDGQNDTTSQIFNNFSASKTLQPLLNSELIDIIKVDRSDYFLVTDKGKKLIESLCQILEIVIE